MSSMGSDEKRLIISGGVTGSFWVLLLGVRLGFPNMIVPFAWALALICVGVLGLLATTIFAVRAYRTKPNGIDLGDLTRAATYSPRRHDPVLDEYERLSRLHLANARAVEAGEITNRISGRGRSRRDVKLAEALGWAAFGEWEKPLLATPFTVTLVMPNIDELLGRFTALGAEGRLTFWGMEPETGLIKKIPISYWHEYDLTIADLFGGPANDPDAYRNLMLNKDEVQSEWPHE